MVNKTLLIVEEALRDRKAHWYSYIKTISDAARHRTWNVDVVCHRDAAPDVLKNLSAHPVFFSSYYLDQSEQKSLVERYFGFVTQSLKPLVVLWSFLNKKHKYDEVFVPTVVMQHLLCWWLIMLLHPKKPKRLTLFFVTNPAKFLNIDKPVQYPKSAKLTSFLLSLFRTRVFNKTVRLAVETKGAKKEFEHISGQAFHLFPHPVSWQRNVDKNHRRYPKVRVFSCFGFARHEKGSDLLKQAVERLVQCPEYADVLFIIQWTDAFKLPDGSLCMPGDVLQNNPQVKLITSAMDSKQYEEWIDQTDCMVLPYRNSSYYARVSRVAIEAACAGIPIIYTKGGWLEELVCEFGSGVGFEDESVDTLLQAIDTMNTGLSSFKSSGMVKSEKAREYFSPHHFIQLLLDK